VQIQIQDLDNDPKQAQKLVSPGEA